MGSYCSTNDCRVEYATVCCLFCCGGLPILALLKAALTFPFCFVITVVGNTLLTLLYLPKNVLHSGRTIVQTPYWGMKLKFLFLLFLPIAALAPLPMVLLGSIFFGLGNPVLVSFASTIAPEDFKNEFLCSQRQSRRQRFSPWRTRGSFQGECSKRMSLLGLQHTIRVHCTSSGKLRWRRRPKKG